MQLFPTLEFIEPMAVAPKAPSSFHFVQTGDFPPLEFLMLFQILSDHLFSRYQNLEPSYLLVDAPEKNFRTKWPFKSLKKLLGMQ